MVCVAPPPVGGPADRERDRERLTEMAGALGALLKEQDCTVAVSGASAYYAGGGVVYTRGARRALIGVPDDVVSMRAATEEYALIMARAVRHRLGATWGLCETGATGPPERAVTLETGSTEREANMWRFAARSLGLLESVLREAEAGDG